MRLHKLHGAWLIIKGVALTVLLALVGLFLWYSWPLYQSLRTEQEHGPFKITACNGFTEETYHGHGPVLFAGNVVYFQDHMGIRHRISGGMVLFSRYDSLGQKDAELFNSLRVPVIYDRAFADSFNTQKPQPPKRKRKIRR